MPAEGGHFLAEGRTGNPQGSRKGFTNRFRPDINPCKE
jgi:hypothetical protein